MKRPDKRIFLGVPAGLLLLAVLFIFWLVRGPFFLGFRPKTDVAVLLKSDDPHQMLEAANHLA